MKKNSPIIFVHNSLPVGGAEQLRLAVCRELLARGVPFRVCVLECASDIGEELISLGVKVDVLGTKQWISDVRVWFKLLAYFKKHQPAIVQSSLFEANTHCRWIAPYAPIPVLFCEEHGLNFRRNWLHEKLDNILQNRSDVVLTVSNAVYDYMRRGAHINPKRLKVLHNCIDSVPLEHQLHGHHLRELWGITERDYVIGHVGALKEEKGHRLLFQSFQQFHRQHSQAKLLLIGDGPMRADLQAYAQQLGIESDVIFAGSRRDMQACFQTMDMFVFPSINEALGIALQEAMFMGLPVIASNQGGMSELIEHDCDGLLVPLDNVGALTNAMLRLKGDEALCLQLGNAARDKMKRLYLPNNYVNQLFQMYRDVYAQKSLILPKWLEVE